MPDEPDPRTIEAGIAAAPLIAEPTSWVNRRVETVELLSHEEVRRQVSVDFTLSKAQRDRLRTRDGVVVPLTVLVKERRRAFSLRDEGGHAVPVLGSGQNGELALAALLGTASVAAGLATEELESVAAELREVVLAPPDAAREALTRFLGRASDGDSAWSRIAADSRCRSLLEALWSNYVLFAVLAPRGADRRILKYEYTEDVGPREAADWRERLSAGELVQRAWHPDRRRFIISLPGAWRAASFHAEIMIPEELRFSFAALFDVEGERVLSSVEADVDRASLHAVQGVAHGHGVIAALEVAPERTAWTSQASAISVAVAGLLWLGVASGLDAEEPDATVSILLAGAAAFAGLTAVLGEHRLVTTIFGATRRWLCVVTAASLTASATLAMAVPDARPVSVWRVAAIVCTVAAARLSWSWLRARA